VFEATKKSQNEGTKKTETNEEDKHKLRFTLVVVGDQGRDVSA